MDTPSETASVSLRYSIAAYSSYSGNYLPENILVDDPSDTASRWSTSVQPNSSHWILLRLETLAVLKSITFGKLYKSHPCNMKEFKILVGMTPGHMTEVVQASLKNDAIPESFSIRYTNNAGLHFPTRYVKIEPLSVHAKDYNTSIWHVSMTGIADEAYVEEVRKGYDRFREAQVLQHVLKYLRQRRLFTPYNSILSRSGLQAEHPLVSELHKRVVLEGDWEKAEQLLVEMSDAGLFNDYLQSCQSYAAWEQIRDTDANGDVPAARGGHAMCIDHQNNLIYMFGGWDGQKSLDDFWVYHIKAQRWRLLTSSTSRERNAPGPRSCHKMVYDAKTNSIYVLGRLSDSDDLKPKQDSGPRDATPTLNSKTISSEFYRYHLESGKWDSLDTSSRGPPVIFDHQMAMDSEAQVLYVFGGRVVGGGLGYSGFYSYDVRLAKWRLLQPAEDGSHAPGIIPSRYGHSMVLEPSTRKLYIFAGQRDPNYLSDMYVYDIASNVATELFSNFTSAGGPEACFTQRAVIDPVLHEIYVFNGLIRNQQSGSTTDLPYDPSSWLYHYHPRPGKWTRILPKSLDEELKSTETRRPSPRFAHQVVYDSSSKTVYLHGGNSGPPGPLERQSLDGDTAEARRKENKEETEKYKRLDDFWKMTLIRPSPNEIIRRATYRIRQQHFKEMCEKEPAIKALTYLQTVVSSVVDHDDAKETEVFRSLLTHLLAHSSPASPTTPLSPENVESHNDLSSTAQEDGSMDTREWTGDDLRGTPQPVEGVDLEHLQAGEDLYERELRTVGEPLSQGKFQQRNEVFESILDFISKDAKQPSGSLLDMVDIMDCT